MIEFVSLLLGLIIGSQPVELSVVGPVAELELRLDGRTVEILRQQPWRFECDFGQVLEPHELEAIARDARGRELGRARHWVNLGQLPMARATMVFSGGERGRPEIVSLVWESLGQRRPRSIELELDGQPLSFADPERVRLPAYDPEEVHFLSATLRFRETVSRLEASFGGVRGGELQTELTAVAVILEQGKRTPRPEELEGWFLVGGEPVPVHGVEEGAADLVVIRDPEVQPLLEELFEMIDFGILSAGGRGAYGNLGRKTSLRVLSPASAPLSPTEVTPEMFVRSASFDAESAGLLWLTQQTRPQNFPMVFSNAVALAGVQAHASTRRRAVVLLLGASPTQPGAFPPQMSRRYLRLLQVPFFVWSLRGVSHPEWPDARAIRLEPEMRPGYRRLKQAVKDLRQVLESQRIVWLEGSFLPQSIELAPEAVGLRLAGRD